MHVVGARYPVEFHRERNHFLFVRTQKSLFCARARVLRRVHRVSGARTEVCPIVVSLRVSVASRLKALL